jgi:hypothetical protein
MIAEMMLGVEGEISAEGQEPRNISDLGFTVHIWGGAANDQDSDDVPVGFSFKLDGKEILIDLLWRDVRALRKFLEFAEGTGEPRCEIQRRLRNAARTDDDAGDSSKAAEK